MAPLRSMTGFATRRSALPDGRTLALTLKAVNHRHLDLSVRLPGWLDGLEPGLRRALKAGVHRGHVELSVGLERAATTGSLTVNHGLLAAHVAAFREAAEALRLSAEPDLNALLRLPGVLQAGTGTGEPHGDEAGRAIEPGAEEEAVLHELLQTALASFNGLRETEGAALGAELRGNMDRVQAFADEAVVLRAGVAAAEFLRLKTRMRDLLEECGAAQEPAEARLLTEAALLAGRGDIDEELVRLNAHIERFRGLLEAGGEAGRPLDFLLQEMNREANTALSKTGASAGAAGLRLTELGLAIKLELERAREQVQNLE